jgi:glycerate dehydrogenase
MSAKPTAVFLDFATLGPDIDIAQLERLVLLRCHDYSPQASMAERLEGADIAIVNKAKISAEDLAGAGRLKLIVLAATGSDNVDTSAAAERGVAVANIRDYCSSAVAQHVFALILGLTQQIGPYDALVRSGAWCEGQSFALFDYPIRELSGRVLGIVGYGALGQAVARLGRCLNMEILVSQRPGSAAGEAADGRVPFETILDRADVLSLHCPLTEATRHLLGPAAFKRMKADAIVINTARGALIDQAALAAALRAGEIAGAGIDVLPMEPPARDEPLLAGDVPNLIVTPHIAWAAREARQRGIDQVAENIESFLQGGDLRRIV